MKPDTSQSFSGIAPRASTVIALTLLALLRPSFADDDIDTFVRSEIERQQIPGASVVVMHHGRSVKAAGYGLANLEHRVPVGASTVFESGSIGKQFTAVAVMLQVEAGKLSLGDSLRKFFPSAPAAWSKISIRHLLNHTSGIPNYTTESSATGVTTAKMRSQS
jgi:CubicO group peptidase (beta-lactamase class C family)